ncbi:alpha/beta fold hydrolase [Cognaticolwellia mytili]|uniref:alpha/beta fold hydrolase n=1 Tax=Cognaticolwellia mytili TaxID=1888913 RepID=UPI000A16E352|nr:alpha/beta hydrolase [Cognaticolwellia mytili]
MKSFIITLFIFCTTSLAFSQEKLTPTISGKFKADSVELYLACYGVGSPTIIVHSGFGGAGSNGKWEEVIQTVHRKNRICVYDRANTGKSDAFTNDYDLNIAVSQLHSLLNSANISPPYIMVGHSFGSYPIKLFNHLYSDEVKGILLVDPSQYGMFYNNMAKWNKNEEHYTKTFEERRIAELASWNNPSQNPEKINLSATAKLIKNSNDFGEKPFVLLWAKDGIWNGGESPKNWHPMVWDRMKTMYKKAIDDMHNLSVNRKIRFANTSEHNIYYYEPNAVVKEIKYILKQVKPY